MRPRGCAAAIVVSCPSHRDTLIEGPINVISENHVTFVDYRWFSSHHLGSLENCNALFHPPGEKGGEDPRKARASTLTPVRGYDFGGESLAVGSSKLHPVSPSGFYRVLPRNMAGLSKLTMAPLPWTRFIAVR
jgi:hypothetical protein